MTPWDFTRSISNSKEDIFPSNEKEEKFYDSFIINKSLATELDCLFYVQELNRRHWLPKRMQYDYLLWSIRKRNRFFKWVRPIKDEFLPIVQEYYRYNYKKAKQALEILTIAQLETLRRELEKGGLINTD